MDASAPGSDDAAPHDAADAEQQSEDRAAGEAEDTDGPGEYHGEDDVPDDAWPDEVEPARATFADLGLSPEIIQAVTDSGYINPTPIQEQAIPIVLMGRDVLGCAQTGTGKTASFVLPMLDILTGSRAKARMPRSLILEPTRELALQVAENFVKYGAHLNLVHALLIGGESMNDQRSVLDKGVDVLIATPGRLLDLFDRGRILLADCKLLVIDEADRMLDMGFIPDVERIVSMLPQLRQTLFFSATMAPEIRRLADAFLQNPKEISVSAPASVATTITAGLVYVRPDQKREALRQLVQREQVSNALIFCNRKVEVDILYKSLKKHGFSAGALHGDMEQSARFSTLNAFKANEIQLLVCSDVAARGLDIGGLSHVFNFDVPFHSEDYVHRIGRTGRAGREGHAYTIATTDDVKSVLAIEKLTGRPIPRITIDGLDVIPEQELVEAATAPKRGRGGRGDAKGGRRTGSEERAPRAAAPRAAAPSGEGEARGDRASRGPRRDSPDRAPRRDGAERAPRRDEGAERAPRRETAERAPRRDIEAETLREAEAPRRDDYARPERRDDHRREEFRRRDREDLGPSVQGFGDAVPAFMLIPIPRPKRDVAPEAETDAAEAA
ncbi:DEAD/DEAH box helicase [Plastoroseomonas arctica]|uniref:DEAD-box ATP-dependent RNA helicase RhpA n=1 Tax=Plastoroseomonas arctica TaxID=1509237 RepID=A0AAF1JY44_9PROT|nr:DEAD/DEAH box helicase [Plastoroseomonas arctica]MBR0656447.1 DEAD/DEAH box helicase [Plastoroseomonas arctica]